MPVWDKSPDQPPLAIAVFRHEAHDGAMLGNTDRLGPSLAMAIAALTVANPALAEPARHSSAVGQVKAQVVLPLKAVAVEDLDFGTVSVSELSGGSVDVRPSAGPAIYGGAAGMACPGTTCTTHPARFVVSGEPGRRYQVTLPSALVATGSAGGAQLMVSNLSLHTASEGDGSARYLDAQGDDSFHVGGRLVIPAATPPDRYRAEVTVLVTYS